MCDFNKFETIKSESAGGKEQISRDLKIAATLQTTIELNQVRLLNIYGLIPKSCYRAAMLKDLHKHFWLVSLKNFPNLP